jgi:hypothetical protein
MEQEIDCKMPHMRYHPGYRLVTWQPQGVLDDFLLDEVAAWTFATEQLTKSPFHRFIDFSHLTQINLKTGHVFKFAHRRRKERDDRPLVRSAFFCDKIIGFGIARLYEDLMRGSSLQVAAFRERAAAAEWLGVPLKILETDAPTADDSTK